MIRNLRPSLCCDTRGSAAVEFAMIAPVLLVGILGIFDLGYNMYTATLLKGAIHKAARDSTVEGAVKTTADLDKRVTRIVHDIAPKAKLTFSRKAYTSYSVIGKAEDFTDINGNQTCDAGEPYEDINANKQWDEDRGVSGLGGARDAVLYEVHVTYPRAFPLYRLVGANPKSSLKARTILRNQPYADSSMYVSVKYCT
jgi:hypothetical protein